MILKPRIFLGNTGFLFFLISFEYHTISNDCGIFLILFYPTIF